MGTGGGADRAWFDGGGINAFRMRSSAAMRTWSSEVDDVYTADGETCGGGAPEYTGGMLEDAGGRRCTEGVPEYVDGMLAGFEGGGACVGGG
ncbi:hypothetical protein CDL15_Pgr019150 [Punica granatum]|uniref:Uncharacterized protein n=1 Tax=Punica granatum TaxID=22663 RepID=A0A218X7C5_PUNGR|nr:hypothetical protein CDL15_Pgr019150 [Punica granatum]